MPAIGKLPRKVAEITTPASGKLLTLPQARILHALSTKKGPINRAQIIDAVSSPGKQTAIGDAMGYADPERRKRRDLEVGHPSLLTQGFVSEIELDLDGMTEMGYEITKIGRQALAWYGDIPPLRVK